MQWIRNYIDFLKTPINILFCCFLSLPEKFILSKHNHWANVCFSTPEKNTSDSCANICWLKFGFSMILCCYGDLSFCFHLRRLLAEKLREKSSLCRKFEAQKTSSNYGNSCNNKIVKCGLSTSAAVTERRQTWKHRIFHNPAAKQNGKSTNQCKTKMKNHCEPGA